MKKEQRKNKGDTEIRNKKQKTIDYGELIIDMVEKIDNEQLLIKIYDFIKVWLN